jgi:DNA-directed RNA polymerase specialized sigma24 family protein
VVRVICKQLRGVLDSDGCLDVYQTVLIAFWRVVARKLAAGAYDPDNPMRLALGIASRAIRAARRKAGRHPFLALVARLDGERAPDGEADECFHRDLLAAFRTLTPVQRRVIDAHLAYLDATGKVRGGRYRRIALDLGLTEAAVRAVFRKAVRKLNTYLKPRGWIL